MPFSPDVAPLVFGRLDEAIKLLRARGLRLSASRRLVLEALFAADGPVSAERIAGGLDGRLPESDVASVYRNLQRFEALGLVRHLHLPHGPGLYEPAGGPRREFLVCERCGEVAVVDPDRLDHLRAELRSSFGYEARFSHFPIVGLCRTCSAAGKDGAALASGGHSRRGAAMGFDEDHDGGHGHEGAHSHEHRHDDGTTHSHPHSEHEHEHVEHEHSHGDRVHSHEHVHEQGLEEEHAHAH